MSENGPVILAEHQAPYTDPGVVGQVELEGDKTFTSVDSKAAGTPPQGTHSGNSTGAGERYASVAPDQEERAQLERDALHTETKDTP